MAKISQKNLLKQVENNIIEKKLINSGDIIILGLSGGADSVCLFDILFKLKDKLNFKFYACHFDHRLRGLESKKDREFVRGICKERGVKLFLGERAEKEKAKSEEQARGLRYKYFDLILKKYGGGQGKVALAHNQNDLVETYLFNLARGSGLCGLHSILPCRDFYIRPLLPFSRKKIELYLKDNNLLFRTDKTNYNEKFSRNFIRSKILKNFLLLNPNFLESVTRNSAILEDDYKLISKEARKKLLSISLSMTDNKIVLERSEWQNIDISLRREILRQAFKNLDANNDISFLHIENIIKLIDNNRGRKKLPLPHSLLVSLIGGKISIEKREK